MLSLQKLIFFNMILSFIQYFININRSVSKKYLDLKMNEKDQHYLKLHKVMNKQLEEKTINFKKDIKIYETESRRLEIENERYEKEIKSLKKNKQILDKRLEMFMKVLQVENTNKYYLDSSKTKLD